MIGYRCASCMWVTEHDSPEDIEVCERCKRGPISLITADGMNHAIASCEAIYCPVCRVFHEGPIRPLTPLRSQKT